MHAVTSRIRESLVFNFLSLWAHCQRPSANFRLKDEYSSIREGQYKETQCKGLQAAIEGASTVTRLWTASGGDEGDEGGERECVLKRLEGDKM